MWSLVCSAKSCHSSQLSMITLQTLNLEIRTWCMVFREILGNHLWLNLNSSIKIILLLYTLSVRSLIISRVLSWKIKIKSISKYQIFILNYFQIRIKIRLGRHCWLSLLNKFKILSMNCHLPGIILLDVSSPMRRKRLWRLIRCICWLRSGIWECFRLFRSGKRPFLPGRCIRNLLLLFNLFLKVPRKNRTKMQSWPFFRR